MLGGQTSGIACERAMSADNTMAGYENRKRIGSVGVRHCTHRTGMPYPRRLFGIRDSGAKRYAEQLLPDLSLEVRTNEQQRYAEYLPLPVEILVQLPCGIGEDGRVALLHRGLQPLRQATTDTVAMRLDEPVAQAQSSRERPEEQFSAGRCISLYDNGLLRHLCPNVRSDACA